MTDEEINEQEQDRFEARFFGTMPEQEAAAFDAELESDTALKERYDLFVLSVRGIRSVATSGRAAPASADLRRAMRAIDEELDAQAPVVRSILRPWMWAAAAAVLLSVAGAWWFTRGEAPRELADEFAIPEPGLPVLMGTSPRSMDAIMNAYKQSDFTTARRLLTTALEQDPQNDTLLYFNGVLEEREEGCASANVWFTHVPASSVFAAKAQYSLALCTLRTGDIPAARDRLRRVAAMDNGHVSARARDLLLRLENK